ncbi:glutamate 5-kinase [Mycobacterium xenopi 4042]|uniref:Glutamate 5-kinase n=1 Tax=Mycobacterium xenopi 4042 TaxID=1299334 RepID=X8AQA2_MYCXE|nr:glutamate 5-kinase [Mycobacterium xenopi 4042]
MKAGSDVVVVSSGAIAAGIEPLGLSRRPADLATKQAAASVGQVALVNSWSAAFARYGRTVAQVLLTAHDISMRVSHTNAQRTLDRLRALHAVPIVNENDTVATNEIRFGDNDRLSALVAHLVGADALVLLSDIDGLYDTDPRKSPQARFIAEVSARSDLDGVVAGRGGHLGTGGMASKVSSALLAADAGCRCCWLRPPTPPRPDRRIGGHRVRGPARADVGPPVLGALRGRVGRLAHPRRGRGAGGAAATPLAAARGNHRAVGPVLRGRRR